MAINIKFLACLYEPGDLVEIRLLPNPMRLFSKVEVLTDLNKRLVTANAAGQHVYIGANPRKRNGGKTQDVALARCLFVDIDHMSSDEALARVAAAGLPMPTCTVNSGHGLHAYWRLTQPLHDLSEWSQAQKRLIVMVGSDPVIHDPPRIMRLPDFVNVKEPPTDCCVVDADPKRRYDLTQILPREEQDQAKHLLDVALGRANPGTRNETGLWLACQLRDKGYSQGQSEELLRRYSGALGDDYTEHEALASVRSAYLRPARPPARPAEADEVADPPIIPLESDGLPEITPDALPGFARDFACAISTAKEVPVAMATLLELAVMAACAQRAYVVQVEESYTEPLCIFAAPSMESGERKTAIHGPVLRPLFDFQKELQYLAKPDQQASQVKRSLMESDIKTLERAYRNATRTERGTIEAEIVELTGKLPDEEPRPQVIVEDFTEAALSVAMAANRESVLVTSDEGGLFDNLSGRHKDVSEIDLFLKAHTGSPHTVNRVGRENIFLERPLMSVGISPQPTILAKLAQKDGFLGRGLTARFLWAIPVSMVGSRKLDAATVDPVVADRYRNGIMAMAHQGIEHQGEPIRLRLSDGAYDRWKAYERQLEPRIGPHGDLRQIKAWASKLPGAAVRIVGVCHVGELLGKAVGTPISADLMARVIEMATLLIPHSVAAHRLMGGGGITLAQDVVHHYDAKGWPTVPQSLTDWWRPVRRIVGETSRDFEPVARILVDHGYLVEVSLAGRGHHGRHYRANRGLSQRVGPSGT